jgi:methionyl aminopeptidase
MSLGTNDRCWCGSGQKYKKCHRLTDAPVKPGLVGPMRPVPADIERPPYIANGGRPPTRNEKLVKPPDVVAAMRKAGLAAGEVLDAVGAAIVPGVTTDELDAVAHAACIERGGYPSPLGYRGNGGADAFPKSICTSVNEVICHGIPSDQVLQNGDIVNVDVTVFLDGVHGDTNATVGVGTVDPRSQVLMDVTREIGAAIQAHAESEGFGVVRTFCGHAIGREFHGDLSIPHYDEPRAVTVLEPGMTFTIEPMITMGSYRERIWPDGWTAVTADGMRTAQFEHTLVVTDDGVEVLTPSESNPAKAPVS